MQAKKMTRPRTNEGSGEITVRDIESLVSLTLAGLADREGEGYDSR